MALYPLVFIGVVVADGELVTIEVPFLASFVRLNPLMLFIAMDLTVVYFSRIAQKKYKCGKCLKQSEVGIWRSLDAKLLINHCHAVSDRNFATICTYVAFIPSNLHLKLWYFCHISRFGAKRPSSPLSVGLKNTSVLFLVLSGPTNNTLEEIVGGDLGKKKKLVFKPSVVVRNYKTKYYK